MFETDLAYAAGLFDGEGCVHIRERTVKLRFSLECQVGMANKEVVEWLQKQFRGSVHFRKYDLPWHKDYWIWLIAAGQARDFLQQILPYLKVKKEHAILAIEFQSRIHWGGRGNYASSPEEIAVRQGIRNKVMGLNARWRSI